MLNGIPVGIGGLSRLIRLDLHQNSEYFFLSIEIELRIPWFKTLTHPAHQPLALVTMSSSNKWSNIFVSPFFILMWNLYVCVYAGISSIPSSIVGCHSLAEFYLGSNSNLFWCKSSYYYKHIIHLVFFYWWLLRQFW